MKLKGFKTVVQAILLILLIALFSQCSGPRYLSIPEVEKDQSVKIYLKNGQVQEGIVKEQSSSELQVISAADHEQYSLGASDISRIEASSTYYDRRGYPISSAEIQKNKKTRNTWGYAIGGAVVGGVVGLGIGYPIWVSNDNPPPLFIAGIGAVLGSIYFATKGIKKDQQAAVEQVRFLRDHDYELEQAKKSEEEKLRELEKQKQELQKKLDEKKKEEGNPQN